MLDGRGQVDGAYVGGGFNGHKAGRDSEDKGPMLAAVPLRHEAHAPASGAAGPTEGVSFQALRAWTSACIRRRHQQVRSPNLLQTRDRARVHRQADIR